MKADVSGGGRVAGRPRRNLRAPTPGALAPGANREAFASVFAGARIGSSRDATPAASIAEPHTARTGSILGTTRWMITHAVTYAKPHTRKIGA